MRQPWLRKHELSGSGPVGRKDKCAMNAPTRPARRGRKTRSDDQLPAQLDWREIRNHMAPLAPLSDDQIESIHLASLRLLEEYGIEVMSVPAREIFRAAGAEVDLSLIHI